MICIARSIDGEPYKVRALVGFGLNLLLSHADAARGAEALRRLEFHVHTDLYLTPTAAFADIVLPVASAWEREGLRVGFGLDQDACELVQFRPAVVAPRGEARADIDIVFDLAVRLGLGKHFWHGDIEAALDYHLAPSGLSVQALRAEPRGIRVPLETAYRKYRSAALRRPPAKIEIYSAALQAIGEPPLPEFRAPYSQAPGFPLTLTAAKTPLYCHSQHRNLARLRRLEPDPLPRSARRPRRLGIFATAIGWRSRRRAGGCGRAQAECALGGRRCRRAARLVAGLRRTGSARLRRARPDGANINLVIGVDAADPVSGAASHRCYPCEVAKLV